MIISEEDKKKFWDNMEKVYENIQKNAIEAAKIAKLFWPPDSDPEIIKKYNREYYEKFEGDYSYFLIIFDLEIDRLF